MKNILQRLYLPFGFVFFGLLFAMLIQTALAAIGPDCDPADDIEDCTVTPTFTSMLIGQGTLPSDGDLKADGSITAVGSIITDDINGYSGGDITISEEVEAPGFGSFYYRSSRCDAAIGGNLYFDLNQAEGEGGPCSSVGTGSNPPGDGGPNWAEGYADAKDYLVAESVSCNDGDFLISCTGWSGINHKMLEEYDNTLQPLDLDQWATFAGTDIGYSDGVWTCQALYQLGWKEDIGDNEGVYNNWGGFDTGNLLEANAVCFSPDDTSAIRYEDFGSNDIDSPDNFAPGQLGGDTMIGN